MASEPRLIKDPEQILRKFATLIQGVVDIQQATPGEGDVAARMSKLRQIRASALNLIARLSSRNSTYFRELEVADFVDALALRGILQAAAEDYREGFLADNKLLVSAEVFADLLVQAEILSENHFYDASAVLAGAVLEDGLRRLCTAHQVACGATDTMGKINDTLYRAGVYTALTQKEITAKAAVRNNAAHGKGSENSPRDVQDLLAYVQRFLAEQLH